MNSVCVYCGSSPGRRPLYAEAARDLAEALVARDLTLVYGGASVGIMGTVADAVLERGGRVIGVIPQALHDKEVAHHGLTELLVTESMHARKLAMAERADAFVALPGGIGTLEELFEMWTWAQLGMHARPCGVLNVGGYFDSLVAFLDHARDEAFLRPAHRDMLCVEDDPERLLARFDAWAAPDLGKWIGPQDT
ncbi:MAG TPA: TIGR00730 family Rossman fold protein [Pseudomonadales bacterium]|nr:TIGR00730 family Rossman fold protein [Pseudomonadales bacterium]